jgi:hypothetical protein
VGSTHLQNDDMEDDTPKEKKKAKKKKDPNAPKKPQSGCVY